MDIPKKGENREKIALKNGGENQLNGRILIILI